MKNELPKKSKFSVTLAKLRQEKGLSQRQAARELGVSQALLSHYETNAREPKLDFVIRLCDYYSVTTDYMLGLTDERRDGASRLASEVGEIVSALEELKEAEAGLMERLKTLTDKEA